MNDCSQEAPGSIPSFGTAGAIMKSGSGNSLDDPDVALGGAAELLERGLIARAVVGRGRLRDAVELDDDDALALPGLVGLRRHATDEEASARRLDGRCRELRVSGHRVGILDSVIAHDPVRLCHDGSPLAGARYFLNAPSWSSCISACTPVLRVGPPPGTAADSIPSSNSRLVAPCWIARRMCVTTPSSRPR